MIPGMFNRSIMFLLVSLLTHSVIFGIPVFQEDPFFHSLVDAAIERTSKNVSYDPAYFSIDYPGGDIPPDKGVCTDLVIRAYRKAGVDLQLEVHQDISENFISYPALWGHRGPDPNIDHRRVPNLMCYFERQGAGLPVSDNVTTYQPGDMVTWDLGGGITHIGIITRKKDVSSGRYLIAHNIGYGPVLEDILFEYKIIGHYRFKK